MTKQIPHNVWPAINYTDAPAAIDFLKKAFGFEQWLVVNGSTDRDIEHAELAWPGGGGVMLGSASDRNEFASRPVGVVSIYCTTDEPDALFDRATGAGAKVVRGLEDTDYGSRGFTVSDPEGNLWSFGTYRGTPMDEA
jgi:uncharacterized glyoxalase superfamily protein PhnB